MTQRPIKLFLKRLKILRKKAKLTQHDIASKLRLNQATYSAMEKGRQTILSNYLFQIAEILRIPVWQIFADAETVGTFDEKDEGFFEMWKRFDSAEREILKAMADQIMQKKALEENQDASFLSEKISKVS